MGGASRKKSQGIGTVAGAFVLWFFVMVAWWLGINASGAVDTNNNYFFGLVLGILPVVGGLVGLKNSHAWGGYASSMGRATGFLSAGLITWGIGTIVFAYYNFFQDIEVPFPSTADFFYAVSWVPFWALGIVNLSKATGVKFSLKKLKGKLQLFLVPLIVAAVSFYLQIIVARGGVIATEDFWSIFFDLYYPIGDVILLTLGLLVFGLSYEYLGGRYKTAIYIVLAGFVVNYFADLAFAWQTTQETFYVANWVDLLFTTAFAMLSLGVVLLDPERAKK